MTYLIGAVVGLAYGVIFGLLKYIFLWRPMMTGKRKINMRSLPISQYASMAINIVVLFSVYLLRHIWPYSFEATLIAAAVGLSLVGQLSPLRDVNKLSKIMNKDQINENTEKYADTELAEEKNIHKQQ